MSKYGLLVMLCLAVGIVDAQSVDSVSGKILSFPSRLLDRVQSRTADINRRLTQQTEKMLREMSRQEAALQKRLAKLDPAAAQAIFTGAAGRYTSLLQKIRSDSGLQGRSFSGIYPAYLDSLQGAVGFLQQNPQLLNGGGASTQQLTQLANTNSQLQVLQAKMMGAEEIKSFVQQRKQQIRQYIAQHSNLQGALAKPLEGMNRQAYYYSQQLCGYKEMWNDPDKLTQRALAQLNRLPAFQTFMKEHSMLAGLFRIPGGYGTSQALSGLQTKDLVAQQIQGKVSAGGSAGAATLQSNLQGAESQLDAYKGKLSSLGAGNGDGDMPNFKPNDQKTKTFLHRLEYGADFQTTRNNYMFPTVTDLGLSLGYKLGHGNVVGVGASYKLGWGNGIQHKTLYTNLQTGRGERKTNSTRF